MKNGIVSVTLLVSLFISTTISAQINASYADSVRRASHIPELSYAVVTDDKILEMKALGVHSVKLPDTATIDDRFHLGSDTKALTAFMIARFVDKGSLKWTTKFFDIFPEWKQASRKEYAHITL